MAEMLGEFLINRTNRTSLENAWIEGRVITIIEIFFSMIGQRETGFSVATYANDPPGVSRLC